MKALLILTIILLSILTPTYVQGRTINSIHIVVTFPNLISDLKQVISPTDHIYSLSPPGIDPHEYSLKPGDIDILKKADLIISTSHTHFEKQIKDLVSRNEIDAVLIEIPYIPGIKIKVNPETKNPNYHMPIYDPYNYKIFMEFVVKKLEELNPSYRDYYRDRLEDVIRRIDEILSSTPRIDAIAVADTPVTQYSVEWLGVKIKYLVMKEHDVQIAPDLSIIEEKLSRREVELVIVTYPVKMNPSKWLEEKARKYGVPILYVLSPLNNKSIIEKLKYISEQVKELRSLSSNGSYHSVEHTWFRELLECASVFIGLTLIGLMVYSLWVRRVDKYV